MRGAGRKARPYREQVFIIHFLRARTTTAVTMIIADNPQTFQTVARLWALSGVLPCNGLTVTESYKRRTFEGPPKMNNEDLTPMRWACG